MNESPTRFPPPWTVHHNDDSYWVQDAAGHMFGFVYFTDRPIVGTDSGVRVSRDEARRLVTNFAKIPDAAFLDEEEHAAVERFIASRSERLTLSQAAKMLLRDALIAIGDMPLGRRNRGPGARRGGA